MERLRNKANKLVAIGLLASTALTACGYQAEAKTANLSVHTEMLLPPTPPIEVGAQLVEGWQAIVADYPGQVDIAVFDRKTGKTVRLPHPNDVGRFDTASIIKLSILEEALIQAQAANQPLSAGQLANAAPMIENSDNGATEALWQAVGQDPTMNDFFRQVGATSTTAGANDNWGNTQTTAPDQLAVVNAVAYPNSMLTPDSQALANDLMNQVESDQRWGVTGGIPSDVSVQLKNGWLPDSMTDDQFASTNSWTVNSIGHVSGEGTDYTIAVLTHGNPTEQDGINIIENLSAKTWQILHDSSNH